MLQRTISILFFSLCCYSSHAQRYLETNFRKYTIRDGLSDQNISGLEQDSAGFLWIGTHHGLNRFDGHIFKSFLHTDEPNSLPDNAVFSMDMVPGQQLCIATDDGAQVISTRTMLTKNLQIPTDDALRYWSNACRYILTDHAGNYAVSTKTGFYIFNPDGTPKKRLDHYTSSDIGRSWMMFGSHLYLLPNGNLLQENSAGFTIYDPRQNSFRDALADYPALRPVLDRLHLKRDCFVFVSRNELLVFNTESNSFDLVNTLDGRIISTPSSLNLQQETGWQTSPVRINDSVWIVNSKDKGFFELKVDTLNHRVSCSAEKYFRSHMCTVVFSDAEKRLWVGTTEGLFMENRTTRTVSATPVFSKGDGSDLSITAIQVTDNRVFAATDKESILVLEKPGLHTIREISFKGFMQSPVVITSIIDINPDTIWIATTSGLIWMHTKNLSFGNLSPGNVSGTAMKAGIFFADKKGNIWIGATRINKIFRYNRATHSTDSLTSTISLLKINIVNSFAEDSQGNIWLGGDAIARWNPRKQKIDSLIEHLPSQKNRKKGYSVCNDSKGDVWVILNDDGLARITGKYIHIRPENLRPDYSLTLYPTMLQDRIFMSSPFGLGFFSIPDLKSIYFNHADGVPENPITSAFFCADPVDQSIWFAAGHLICRLPFLQNEQYATAPAFHITEVSVINNKRFDYPEQYIRLPYNQNDLRIAFSAVNYTDPLNMRFAYRFKDQGDSSWLDLGDQQNLLLTNMSPGTYPVEIKAYAFDNKWQAQVKTITVRIDPPFWNTAGFYVALILLLGGLIYFLYRYRIRQIKQKANLDKLLAETEMKALHAQMNPHFIFNCLNSIREMILNNENRQASRYLSKFAQMIRITLNHSTRPLTSLQQTLDYLHRYLEMEQIRTAHFRYRIEVDEELEPESIMLPPMLIQPFLENAIWHGPRPQDAPMDLFIRFQLSGKRLLCIIEDNGIGIGESMAQKKTEPMSHQSVGIENIRQRIQVLNKKYDFESTITIQDKNLLGNGSGTIVTLYLPIKNTFLS
jgi:ligand-binding sensor domain-containing protein